MSKAATIAQSFDSPNELTYCLHCDDSLIIYGHLIRPTA